MTVISKEMIESEYKKWSEYYEIPFETEFEVKALIELQLQYYATPNDHIRTKTDILNAIHTLKRNLGLKKKTSVKTNKKPTILIVTDYSRQIPEITELFAEIIHRDLIESIKLTTDNGVIDAKNVKVIVRPKGEFHVRGTKFDHFINLTGDKQFENEFLRKH